MKNLKVLLALSSIVGLFGLSSCASTCKDKACSSCCSSGGEAKKECCVKAGGECKACAAKKAAEKKS